MRTTHKRNYSCLISTGIAEDRLFLVLSCSAVYDNLALYIPLEDSFWCYKDLNKCSVAQYLSFISTLKMTLI